MYIDAPRESFIEAEIKDSSVVYWEVMFTCKAGRVDEPSVNTLNWSACLPRYRHLSYLIRQSSPKAADEKGTRTLSERVRCVLASVKSIPAFWCFLQPVGTSWSSYLWTLDVSTYE